MTYPMDAHMKDILALTRTGRLAEATEMIQRTLGGSATGAQTAGARPPVDLRSAAPVLPAPGGAGWAAGEAARPSAPKTARGKMDRHNFRSAAGSLDYLLYVPQGLSKPAPLVVMLHGCTQSAEDFARGTKMNVLADELGFIVAYPEQTRAANAQKCWNWFRPGDQGKASGEPAMIAGITREICTAQEVDRARIYVAGLSAGGAAAAIMADAFPDIFAAAGVHSGLACGSASDLPSALAAMQGRGKRSRANRSSSNVPLITFHGDRDSTVHPVNSDQMHEAWATAPDAAGLERKVTDGKSAAGQGYRKIAMVTPDGQSMAEHWVLRGAGHAWSGGSASGTYTDPKGPDASREMLRFFLQHRLKR